MRRISLSLHELSVEYLEILEKTSFYDEDAIIDIYNNILNFSPECEINYLHFLVRRINKHIFEDQLEEYNNTWGNKVVFFRE